ncbi:MAG: hypothetical protein ACKOGI_04105 [Vulcanococcus sp.]
MRRVPFLAAGLAALALAACQPVAQKQPSEKVATGDVCTELTHVAEALEQVNGLKPTSTVGEAQSVNKHLGKALKGLKAAEADLEKARLTDFQAKLKAFKKEVAKVSKSKGLTLEQAAADLKTKAAPVVAAHKELTAAVNCTAPTAKP